MSLNPCEVLVHEDSENSVTAAKNVGFFTIAIPNSVTRDFSFEKADLILSSLENESIEWLINRTTASN